MKLKEFIPQLKDAVQAGAQKALAQCGSRQHCTKATAYRAYGRSNVDRWIAEGLLSPISKKIDQKQLERVAATSNRNSYLTVAER
jgi:hypothetical protein